MNNTDKTRIQQIKEDFETSTIDFAKRILKHIWSCRKNAKPGENVKVEVANKNYDMKKATDFLVDGIRVAYRCRDAEKYIRSFGNEIGIRSSQCGGHETELDKIKRGEHARYMLYTFVKKNEENKYEIIKFTLINMNEVAKDINSGKMIKGKDYNIFDKEDGSGGWYAPIKTNWLLKGKSGNVIRAQKTNGKWGLA